MASSNVAIGLGVFLGGAVCLIMYKSWSRKEEEGSGLSERKIKTIQDSWKKVSAVGVEKVGILLFKNVFKAAPSALAMFSFKDEPDLYNNPKFKAHGKLVVSTVGTAVAGLRDLDSLVTVLKNLGRAHVAMNKGIAPVHYDVVGEQLIATLRECLKSDFTPEVEKAWVDVYAIVSATMQSV